MQAAPGGWKLLQALLSPSILAPCPSPVDRVENPSPLHMHRKRGLWRGCACRPGTYLGGVKRPGVPQKCSPFSKLWHFGPAHWGPVRRVPSRACSQSWRRRNQPPAPVSPPPETSDKQRGGELRPSLCPQGRAMALRSRSGSRTLPRPRAPPPEPALLQRLPEPGAQAATPAPEAAPPGALRPRGLGSRRPASCTRDLRGECARAARVRLLTAGLAAPDEGTTDLQQGRLPDISLGGKFRSSLQIKAFAGGWRRRAAR